MRTGVLVVGAGPTGLMLATELRRHGVDVLVVEREPRPSGLSKAAAVQARTLEVLDQVGLGDAAGERALPITGADLYADGAPLLSLDPRSSASDHGPADLAQGDTEAILAGRLAELGAEVHRGTELLAFRQDELGVTATLRGGNGTEHAVRAAFLAGCDGKDSAVRTALRIGFEGRSLPELWAMLEAPVDWDVAADHWQLFFSGRGPFIAFPFHRGDWRLGVDLPGAPPVDRLPDPAPADFLRHAAERGAPVRGIGTPSWSGYFRVTERLAARYRAGRAFLCGDAAHVHSPAGGQGMNTGLQDAHNLAWKLALALRARALAPALLDSYEAERRPVAHGVLRRSGTMLRLGATRNPAARRLRDALAPRLTRLGSVAERVAASLGELDLDYGASPLVSREEGSFAGGPAPGRRAPDAAGLRAGDRRARLYEALREPAHLLLRFGGAALQAPPGVPAWDAPAAADPAWGVRSPSAYLLRPDGYVAWRGPPDPPALERALRRSLGAAPAP